MPGPRPGHPREHDLAEQDVDGRHKAGHDVLGGVAMCEAAVGSARRGVLLTAPTHDVMPGPRPGHPREDAVDEEDVDGRHKAGHYVLGGVAMCEAAVGSARRGVLLTAPPHYVMPGPRPGHPREHDLAEQDVDGRHKAG